MIDEIKGKVVMSAEDSSLARLARLLISLPSKARAELRQLGYKKPTSEFTVVCRAHQSLLPCTNGVVIPPCAPQLMQILGLLFKF
jgi:hypothetical protein